MDAQQIYVSDSQKPLASRHRADAGFALVVLIALVPLLLAVFTAVFWGVHGLVRKSTAQATCIHRNALLAEELGKRLKELLALNTEAKFLRRELRLAKAALRVARATNFTPGIVGAEAWIVEIELERKVLNGRQQFILLEAQLAVVRHHVSAVADSVELQARRVRWASRRDPALAVKAVPPGEVAPEYRRVTDFARRQAQTLSFDLEIVPEVPGMNRRDRLEAQRQKTSCTVTLRRKDSSWVPKIIAANARSKSF